MIADNCRGMLEPTEKPIRRLPPAQIAKIGADIELLSSTDEREAWRAVARLGRRRGRVVEFLAEATASPNPDVRHLALHALERVGDPRAYPVVLAMIDDPEPDNRWCALEILAKLGGERAIPVLIKVLQTPESDPAELQGAVAGLKAIGSPTIPALIDLMRDNNPILRQRASGVLRHIADPDVIKPLARLLNHPDSWTRINSIEVLAALGEDHPAEFGPRCLALIEPLLSDVDEEVRKSAEYECNELRSAFIHIPQESHPPSSNP